MRNGPGGLPSMGGINNTFRWTTDLLLTWLLSSLWQLFPRPAAAGPRRTCTKIERRALKDSCTRDTWRYDILWDSWSQKRLPQKRVCSSQPKSWCAWAWERCAVRTLHAAEHRSLHSTPRHARFLAATFTGPLSANALVHVSLPSRVQHLRPHKLRGPVNFWADKG